MEFFESKNCFSFDTVLIAEISPQGDVSSPSIMRKYFESIFVGTMIKTRGKLQASEVSRCRGKLGGE